METAAKLPVEDEAISGEGLDRIRRALPDGATFRSPPIELAAAAYRTFKTQEASRTGRGMKADLKVLARKVGDAAEALANLPPSTMALLGIASQMAEHGEADSRPIPRLREVAGELQWLRGAIDTAIASSRRPYVDRTPFSLEFAILLLAGPYRRATGAKITHSAHEDGEYRGGARSPFGRFALAFFAEVDPKVSATSIGNVIRKHLTHLSQALPD